MSLGRWSLGGVLSLVLLSACPPPANPPIVMPADSLGDTTVGVAYSKTLTATGGTGTLTYSATGLPAGLAMSGSGAISGTATASGDFTVAVQVTDTAGQVGNQSYPLKVYDAVAIATASLPNGVESAAYSATIVTSGGKPPVALTQTSGTLPAGLAFTASSGLVSGTPTAPGPSGPQVFRAVDANGSAATATFSFTIQPQLTLTATLPSTANVGTAYSGLLTASGGLPPLTFGVASGQLPPGITVNASSGAVSGTPTFAGTFTATLSATDAGGLAVTRVVTVAVFSNPPPAVVTSTLANGVTGAAYVQTLAGQDGQPPYSWALSTGSSLPAGLSLSTSGQISGTPTAAGSTSFQVTLTDANGQTARKNLTIAVFTPLQITTTSLPEGYATLAYPATTLGATGGQAPYTWSLTGTLPAGVTFNAGAATLSGTAAAGSAGSYGITFTVSDASGQARTAPFTIDLYALPAVATTTLADGAVGGSYSQTLQATGGKSPLSWQLTSGALPAGILLDSMAGTLVGSPTTAGTATFTVQVTDANGKTGSRVLTLRVFAGLVITYGPAPDGYVGAAYSQTLTASGGVAPYTWSLVQGSLPAGVTLSASAGTLTGTPTAPGTSNFTLQVQDATSSTNTKALGITVLDALAVTTASLADGYTGGTAYSQALAATGGKSPYRWAASPLPNGLSIGATTGLIAGNPTATGTTNVAITVTDANNATATRSLPLTVYAPPVVTPAILPDAYPSIDYAATVNATGGKAPYTFAAGAGLPAGLLMLSSGAISGRTTAPPGSASFTVTATDANGVTGTQSFSIIIRADVGIAPAALADGYAGATYSQAIVGSGGKTPYAYSVSAGALPAGVTLDPVSGALGGAPTAAGTATFTAKVTDANGAFTSRVYTIQTYALPSITTLSLASAAVGAPYSQPISVTGGKTPIAWAQTGTLPAGITFDTAAGTFSGTTNVAPGSFPGLTVTATDANGRQASRTYTLQVANVPSITTTAVNDAYATVPFTQTFTAAGGSGGGYTFAVTNGSLPAGLTLSSAGVLGGTPAGPPGISSFTVTVTDSASGTGSKLFNQTVYALPSIATASPLPDGYRSIAYSATLAATGGVAPYTFSITAGALPTGLALNAGSGAITGTPTASGTFTPTFTVTDVNGKAGSKALSLTVQPGLAIGNSSLPDGYASQTYSATLSAVGGLGPYSFAVTSGALPPGLSLSSGGAFSGTPGTTGTFNFSVTVTDQNATTSTRSLAISVYLLPFVTANYPDGYVTQPYSGSTTGTGGKLPYTFSITSGALPGGLVLNSSTGAIGGVASGTTQTFVVTLADANGVTSNQIATISIYQLPSITSTSVPDGYTGQGYFFTLASTGGKAPLSWSQSSGALPPGLALSPTGTINGTIGAGAPLGPYSFTASLVDANGRSASAAFTLTLYAPLMIPIIDLGPATEGVTYIPMQVPTSGGKPPLTYAAAGLPGGIVIAAGTGILSGIPAQGTAGFHSVTLNVTDANGMSVGTITLLEVLAARPIYGGGTAGVAPGGSPITDTLTVFTTDGSGHAFPNLGVRLRKNGVEFAPVKQQVTDSAGKTVFTGLGLNGTTDTVDITVNGPNAVNESWQRMNAAIVSIPLIEYPMPVPRAFANGEIDPGLGKLIVTAGMNTNGGGAAFVGGLLSSCQNDLIRLSDSVAGTWVEDLPPGLTNSPPARQESMMAYSATVSAHVLFGGLECAQSNLLNDVWQYSAGTNTWTQKFPSGALPASRHQAAMVSLANGNILLYGGNLDTFGVFPVDDLRSYAPATSTWTLLSPPAPVPAAKMSAGATAVGNVMWLCGGVDGTGLVVGDCWSYDATSNLWTSRAALPSPRFGPGMVATPAGAIYVFGGSSGVELNDLLLLSGGAWTSPLNNNPPPPREGAVLAVEPSTGNLLMFGGLNASTGQVYSDLWSYNPASGAWTQRAPTYALPPPGFTISGTITGAATSSRSRVQLQATGTSGYVNRPIVPTPGGSGSFTLAGIPPGDTIALTALNEDLSQTVYPNRAWSYLDLGVVVTNIGSDMTQNITLPPGPMTSQLLTTTGSFTLPADWLGTDTLGSLSRLLRPGFSGRQYAPDGTSQIDFTALTFRNDYYPHSPTTAQMLLTSASSAVAGACESLTVYAYNVAPGPYPSIVVPTGPRNLSPGLNPCIPVGTGLRANTQVDGTSPVQGGVAVADLNGDGIADLAMVDGNQLLLYYGQGSGAGEFFDPPSVTLQLSATGPGNGIGIADFDRDGRLDIAVGLTASAQVAVVLQPAPGLFIVTQVSSGAAVTGSLSVGDVNNDSVPDIVLSSGSQVWELNGNGGGGFQPPVSRSFVAQVTALSNIADLNGDGIGDLAYGLANSSVGFLVGNAGGNLGQGPNLTGVVGTPASIATGDLDNDSIRDLAIATQSPALQTFRGQGGFGYAPVSNRPLISTPVRVGIAEMTGDSLRDVVLVQSDGEVVELSGTGGAVVAPFFSTFSTPQPQALALADVNADGNTDVVVGGAFPPTSAVVLLALRPIPAGTDALAFTAPANTRLSVVQRGPADVAWDYEVVAPTGAGPSTVAFPLLSTLRSGRPAPVGQTVGWYPTLYLAANPANVNPNDMRLSLLHPDAIATPSFDPLNFQTLMPRYRR